MVNTLVESRLSSVLPSAFTNLTNTSTLHPDVLSMFHQSLQNNLQQQQPPPPSVAPVSSTQALFSATAQAEVTPGINDGNLTAGVNNLYANLVSPQQQLLQQQLNYPQSSQAQSSDF